MPEAFGDVAFQAAFGGVVEVLAVQAVGQELLSGGVGEEPALEDAYGAHLMDRSRADDLMSMLAHGRRNFRSKVDPQTRPRLTVPHALAEDAGHQEMSDPMSDPMSGQMSGQEDDE